MSSLNYLIENVALGERAYEIVIGTDQQADFASTVKRWVHARNYLQTRQSKALFISDAHTQVHAEPLKLALEKAGFQCFSSVVPAGESSKSQAQLDRIYDELVSFQADRRTLVIAVGGGVIGDLAGFAAASFNRGLPFIQVPTSLLATVDSSVGGKVGINHPKAKNLIGAFHQPLGVWIDTRYFETLPEREFVSGLAEVVKYGVIMDPNFFHDLERDAGQIIKRDPTTIKHIIARSCRIKADVVEQDEYERTGLRAILNYGHTFAHAYEALAGYGTLLHGEAVSIGMVAASKLADKIGRITPDVTQRQIDLLSRLNLPVALPPSCKFSPQEIINCMFLDKKTVGGELRFILPTRIGFVETVSGINVDTVREVLELS